MVAVCNRARLLLSFFCFLCGVVNGHRQLQSDYWTITSGSGICKLFSDGKCISDFNHDAHYAPDTACSGTTNVDMTLYVRNYHIDHVDDSFSLTTPDGATIAHTEGNYYDDPTGLQGATVPAGSTFTFTSGGTYYYYGDPAIFGTLGFCICGSAEGSCPGHTSVVAGSVGGGGGVSSPTSNPTSFPTSFPTTSAPAPTPAPTPSPTPAPTDTPLPCCSSRRSLLFGMDNTNFCDLTC